MHFLTATSHWFLKASRRDKLPTGSHDSWSRTVELLRSGCKNALTALTEDWSGLRSVWELLRQDSKFILKAAGCNGEPFAGIEDRLHSDNEFFLTRLQLHRDTIRSAHEQVKSSRKFLLHTADVDRRFQDEASAALYADLDVSSRLISSGGSPQRQGASRREVIAWADLKLFSMETREASASVLQAAIRYSRILKRVLRGQRPSTHVRLAVGDLCRDCERMLYELRQNHRALGCVEEFVTEDRRSKVVQLADLRQKQADTVVDQLADLRQKQAEIGCSRISTTAAARRPASAPAATGRIRSRPSSGVLGPDFPRPATATVAGRSISKPLARHGPGAEVGQATRGDSVVSLHGDRDSTGLVPTRGNRFESRIHQALRPRSTPGGQRKSKLTSVV